MSSSSLALTFGVELETVFAFHETALRTHLDNTNNISKIVKDIPDDVRRKLNQTNDTYLHFHRRYMGWGLTTPPTFIVESDDQEWKLHRELKNFGYRGYANEILTLAQSLLQSGVRVHDSFANKYDQFDSWHLTHDRSVVGVDKTILSQNLHLADRSVDNINDWDSHGIELVSRVLPLAPASFEEINNHLTILRGDMNSSYAAFTNENCGFHVHIGLPPPPDLEQGMTPPTFELGLLQHLAYLTVMYEEEISKMHPRSRRGGGAMGKIELVTNLDSFIEEPVFDDEDLDTLWDQKPNISSLHISSPDSGYGPRPTNSPEQRLALLNTTEMQSKLASIRASPVVPYPGSPISLPITPSPTPEPTPAPAATLHPDASFSFRTARSKIFAKEMTVEKLANLMCGTTRGSLVNWTYLPRTNGLPRTIEFRQHEGTLDPVAVRWWVEFCAGLVRSADKMAKRYGAGVGYDGKGYRYGEWRPEMRVGDLLEMMEMPEEGRVHFRGMLERNGGVRGDE